MKISRNSIPHSFEIFHVFSVTRMHGSNSTNPLTRSWYQYSFTHCDCTLCSLCSQQM